MNHHDLNSSLAHNLLLTGLVAMTLAGAGLAQSDGSDQRDADAKRAAQHLSQSPGNGGAAFEGVRCGLGLPAPKPPSETEMAERKTAAEEVKTAAEEAERPISSSPNPNGSGELEWMSPDQRAVYLASLDTPGVELAAAPTRNGIEFRLVGHGSSPGEHFGGILVSLEDRQCLYVEGLPPMLCGGAVLGIGIVSPALRLEFSRDQLPGMPFYAQGVLAGPEAVFASQVIRIDGDLAGRVDQE
ncbi:MAG: hypothetical protein NXI31_04060 [bacterium]|nr:hypothetical protein [bacterium]